MKCRSCGTEIAEKAIVCFRCGTPTDIPAVPPKPHPRPRAPVSAGVLVLVAIVALGLWLLPPAMAEGASSLYAGWAAALVAAAAVAWWLRRRR
jgi:hypothetical protein